MTWLTRALNESLVCYHTSFSGSMWRLYLFTMILKKALLCFSGFCLAIYLFTSQISEFRLVLRGKLTMNLRFQEFPALLMQSCKTARCTVGFSVWQQLLPVWVKPKSSASCSDTDFANITRVKETAKYQPTNLWLSPLHILSSPIPHCFDKSLMFLNIWSFN